MGEQTDRHWRQVIMDQAAGATVRERGRAAVVLCVAVAAVVLLLGSVLPRSRPIGPVNVEILWALTVFGLVASSSSRRLQPVWERIAGVVTVVMIAVLVAATGGVESPYHLLYLVNGIYGAAYYPLSRLLIETSLSVVAFIAPAFYDPAPNPTGTEGAIVAVLVFLGVVAFVAWLVDRARSGERQRLLAQSRYEAAFDASPLPIMTIDSDGRIREVNPAVEAWSGFDAEDLVGRSFERMVAPTEREAARGTFERVISGEAIHGELTAVDAHGRRRVVVTTGLPFQIDDHRVGAWTMFRDVTGVRTPVESLRASEERYRRLVDNLPAVVYEAPPGYFRGEEPLWFISSDIDDWLGYPAMDWISRPDLWLDVVHPDDRRRVVRETLGAYAEGHSRRTEYRVTARDGSERWVLDQAHAVPGPDGEPGWVQGVVLDITAEKRSGLELEERMAIQRALSDYAQAALRVRDFSSIASRALETATRMSGSTAAALYLVSRDVLEPAYSIGWSRPPVALPLEGAGAVSAAVRGVTGEFDPSGPLATAGFRAGLAVPIGRAGGPYGVLAIQDVDQRHYTPLQREALQILAGSISDALDREATFDQLRRGEELAAAHASRLQALVDASPLPIVELDADGSLLGHNLAAARGLGLDDEDTGRPLRDRLPTMAPVIDRLSEAAVEGRMPDPVEVTTNMSGRDGRVLQLYAGPRPSEGQVSGVIIFFVDVTERRALENHVSQVDKMEAIARLAGGVAHDVNNLLTVIRGYAELARTADDPATITDDLDGIVEVTKEGSELVNSFLGLARDDEVEDEIIDLQDAITADRAFLGRVLPPGATLVVESEADPPPVIIPRQHLRRMLLNLVTNAADALDGEPGDIHIRLASDDETVTVAVCDEGVGMDQSTVAHVFEPFFTRKADRGGSGLGLFTVYRIARRYGIRIEIESEVGHGTDVRLIFPPAAQLEGAVERSSSGTPPQTRITKAGILVVEDDDRVRELTERILTGAGHAVETVTSAEAALETLGGDTFDVLLSDVVLPGMDGIELAALARRRQPGIAVILMSGHASDVALRNGIQLGALELLPKPFSSQGLLERVEESLR